MYTTQVLSVFVWNCLLAADERRYTSIVFPLIGNKDLSIPAQVVFRVLNDVVDKFEHEFPETTLKTVNFFIEPDENDQVKTDRLIFGHANKYPHCLLCPHEQAPYLKLCG